MEVQLLHEGTILICSVVWTVLVATHFATSESLEESKHHKTHANSETILMPYKRKEYRNEAPAYKVNWYGGGGEALRSANQQVVCTAIEKFLDTRHLRVRKESIVNVVM